jgi:hypothetical protein
MGVDDGTLFDQIMNSPLPQIYRVVWRSDITEVRRRSPASRMCGGEPPGAQERVVATNVKELGLFGCGRRPGVGGAPVAGGAARGLGAGGGARVTWAGRDPCSRRWHNGDEGWWRRDTYLS